ncbi:MAG: hypothetical protein HN384_01885 [Nitrosopumilus sp.]|jgi:hypothetical protein|nr:hypothetical protein [Nitrosopumilus sp.]MBT3573716.1 hypothetical protein [Nitrosopumilus sp.]MBT4298617.1 hypothetical protein [Nitrosopumilus sp.]MBT4535848.1 hypothetical protein [Nitrosopumilus sp.]
MSKAIFLTVLLAGLIMVGTSTPVLGAQFDSRINPNNDDSPFKVSYLKTVFIEYPNGGALFDVLRSSDWKVSGTADATNPGVQELMMKLNQGIRDDGSQATISDLNVLYEFQLTGRSIQTSIDYRVILEGTITNYVITEDSQKKLVDLGWRGLSTTSSIMIDGIDINIPLGILQTQEPIIYNTFVGTEAEDVLNRELINADFILEQPMTNWHFLFDPTGINADASTFGLDDSIAGFVVSSWTMGESSIREGRQVERVYEAEVMADELYTVRSVQSSDQANLHIIGFGAIDVLDSVEIVGVTPTPPEDYMTTSTGGFPIMVIYGMAGMAAIGGIGFFIVSSRSMKNTSTEQQGIDPGHLVGYQTSASSGGYQTNRGEAQLKSDDNYAQTRSVYESTETTSETTPEIVPEQTMPSSDEEAACGCAASAEIGTECDCEMHGSCLCDATCHCNADICKDQVREMS